MGCLILLLYLNDDNDNIIHHYQCPQVALCLLAEYLSRSLECTASKTFSVQSATDLTLGSKSQIILRDSMLSELKAGHGLIKTTSIQA